MYAEMDYNFDSVVMFTQLAIIKNTASSCYFIYNLVFTLMFGFFHSLQAIQFQVSFKNKV